MEYKTEARKRNCVWMELKQIDYISKDTSFMELTEWTNSDGFDCTIDDSTITITWGQFKAMKLLVKKLKNESKI